MLKRQSRDYSQSKPDDSISNADTDVSDTFQVPTKKASDYFAFDISGNLTKNVLAEHGESVFPSSVDFRWLFQSSVEEALSYFLEWSPTTIILYFMTNNST